MDKDLLFKYNVPGPRYTSYPTVPYWQQSPPTQTEWNNLIKEAFSFSNRNEGVSLYIHLPYCESLCTYCGCNTRITINHAVEKTYIESLLHEWSIYKRLFEGQEPVIKEIHLGGGTPTFFSPENLTWLIKTAMEGCRIHPEAQFSFEAHPGNTTDSHLEALYRVGFRRISIGVQDFSPIVLAAINRHQTFEQIRHLTQKSREMGYTSINYDMIYGLPFQKSCSMMETMIKVVQLKPDRIAFYSYAHIPWIKPSQRSYSENDLPDADKKLALYQTGKNVLELAGYQDIGMDHFALKSDALFKASQEGKLHRNFMGYTEANTRMLIGLGTSAISDTWFGFAQNEKNIDTYTKRLQKGELPIYKGHELTKEDLIIRKHILNLMTRYETHWPQPNQICEAFNEGLQRMDEMVKDELVILEPYRLRITDKGRAFIRNICMALDARLWADKPINQIFSKTV
ncbi:oxygen-independent coproporphyrinogen III oxidase [Dyadobacter tibetensis]|uniref:oxygen-independent coproporphyrinogen III oxidase n=1 Tax=Dyadobacter tibetensis TaxID=1211851 RepID=UPI00046F7792|nr:oxygen-independent coproporphyrinogen III oxidase [Dyadobacter tibetensis]